MENEQHLKQQNGGGTTSEVSREDLAKLFNYPSVGQLFSEAGEHKLRDFLASMNDTRSNLERVVRYGSRDEAARAERAARAVEVTISFLEKLQTLRLEQKS